MKKILCAIFMAIIFVIGGMYVFNSPKQKNEYIRIHIRANSNEEYDQFVKYKVKDTIIEYLTPLFIKCEDKQQFENTIKSSLDKITNIATSVLKENGFFYSANAKYISENFPTRCYNGVVLENGIYDSIIVELGQAKGDNWWCVVYPPLCFLNNGSNSVIYKSKIAEIVKNIFNG